MTIYQRIEIETLQSDNRAESIDKFIFFNENIVFWSKFHWNLFLLVKSTVNQHWFR